jgi:hypothetical protein
VEQAYLRLELVEHLAKIDYYASHMGMPMLLTNEEVSLLLEKRAAAGLDPAKSSITAVPASKHHSQVEEIKRLIIEEIKKVL